MTLVWAYGKINNLKSEYCDIALLSNLPPRKKTTLSSGERGKKKTAFLLLLLFFRVEEFRAVFVFQRFFFFPFFFSKLALFLQMSWWRSLRGNCFERELNTSVLPAGISRGTHGIIRNYSLKYVDSHSHSLYSIICSRGNGSRESERTTQELENEKGGGEVKFSLSLLQE